MSGRRISRNVTEKLRKDKINCLIKELGSELPYESNRPLDKTSIIRLGTAYAHFENLLQNLKKNGRKWRDKCLNSSSLINSIEQFNGFVIVAFGNGKLLHVSKNSRQHLGYENFEMIGHDIQSFIYSSDSKYFDDCLHQAKMSIIRKGEITSKRFLYRGRMKMNSQSRSHHVSSHVPTRISGWLSVDPNFVNKISAIKNNDSTPSLHIIDEDLKNFLLNDDRLFILKATIEIITRDPLSELNMFDADLEEYNLRMTLDGKLIHADHRIALVTGFQPSEIFGQSAYNFILADDHDFSLLAHRAMIASSSGTGCVVQRLRIASGGFIYVQSAGCLQYDKVTGIVDHFVCVVRHLRDDEGSQEREKFVRKFRHLLDKENTPRVLYESLQVAIGEKRSEITYDSISSLSESDLENSLSDSDVILSSINESSTTDSNSSNCYLEFDGILE